jgi:hypothetical protein
MRKQAAFAPIGQAPKHVRNRRTHGHDMQSATLAKQGVQVLLDADYYALYSGNNDVMQASADLNTVKSMVASIKGKFRSSVDELAKVLRCLDDQHTGAPSRGYV